MNVNQAAAAPDPSLPDEPLPARMRWRVPALAGVIVLAVYSAAMPGMDAPWLLGDEHVFIVNNSDITGRDRAEPLGQRLRDIFTNIHEDLYQPIPIASYAIEWQFSKGDPLVTRRTDVMLHAFNALLVWTVLYAVLFHLGAKRGRWLLVVTWTLALLWALHPIQITSYVADMCRTHLLSAMFSLIALLLHLRALVAKRRAWLWFTLALPALTAAMLSKPVVGWFLLVIALEWAIVGPRVSLRSPCFYVRTAVVTTLCLFFAILTLKTSALSGMMEDTSDAVFGGPLTRSLFALWLYFRNLVFPLRLSTWYLSDPTTAWSSPRVWFGLVFVGAGLCWLVRAARRPAGRGIALGIAWWWALLGPVIGLVAARIAAANDRYMYQPLIGVCLIVGVLLVRNIPADQTTLMSRRLRILLAAAIPLAAFMLLIDRAYCRAARSTISRAQQVVERYPGDPRGLEYLAQAYDFATTRLTPEAAEHDADYFRTLAETTYVEAGRDAAEHPEFFPSVHDRAAFHRRLAFRLLQLGIGEPPEKARAARQESLSQARVGRALEPGAPMSLIRVAQAYRSLGQWNDALAAYQQLEKTITPDAPNYALINTEIGMLLDTQFQRHDLAREKYETARRADPSFLPAAINLARLEIRFGSGQAGYDLVREVLTKSPDNLEAQLLAGEYHLRSNHWNDALNAYLRILDVNPLQYDALRGFHESCANLGRWSDAVRGWDFAARNARHGSPEELVYRSFEVWASACANEPRAMKACDHLMRVDPNNRFACLTRMLFALREGKPDEAIDWVTQARKGRPLTLANEFGRAIATLRLLRRDAGLGEESIIVEAALEQAIGRADVARRLLTTWEKEHPSSGWSDLAAQLLKNQADSPPQP